MGELALSVALGLMIAATIWVVLLDRRLDRLERRIPPATKPSGQRTALTLAR